MWVKVFIALLLVLMLVAAWVLWGDPRESRERDAPPDIASRRKSRRWYAYPFAHT